MIVNIIVIANGRGRCCLMLCALLIASAGAVGRAAGDEVAAAKPQQVKSDGRFSFGGQVEVLALGTHGEEADTWWDEQGKPLKALPAPLAGCFVRQWDDEGKPLASLPISWKKNGSTSSPDRVWRRIIFRIHDLPDDSGTTWSVTGARAAGSAQLSVHGEVSPKGYFSRYFSVAENQSKTNLKVGVATGLWKTEAKTHPRGMSAVGRGEKHLLMSETFDGEQGAVIHVSHNYHDEASRLVAIDKQGTTHPAAFGGSVGAGNASLMQAVFGKLKRDDIDHIEFQTRPYEFVELNDLPLQPAPDDEHSDTVRNALRGVP